MNTDIDVSRFREHRSREECERLLNHGHFIPVSRGYTSAFVAENYPGWTWKRLVAVFRAAGILVRRDGTPPTCDERVVTFHFSSPTDFFVEWIDGSEPADVAQRRSAEERGAAAD